MTLREMTKEDTPLIVKWRNNERVRANFVFREPFTSELHMKWFRERIEQKRDVAQWIICEDGGRPVGSAYLRDIDREAGAAEYGIFIGEDDALGKGYGNAAVSAVKDKARDELKLKRLYLKVFTDNEPAKKSYERAGFEIKRVLKAVRCSDGAERDMFYMETEL